MRNLFIYIHIFPGGKNGILPEKCREFFIIMWIRVVWKNLYEAISEAAVIWACLISLKKFEWIILPSWKTNIYGTWLKKANLKIKCFLHFICIKIVSCNKFCDRSYFWKLWNLIKLMLLKIVTWKLQLLTQLVSVAKIQKTATILYLSLHPSWA